jgi:hypothetical protein
LIARAEASPPPTISTSNFSIPAVSVPHEAGLTPHEGASPRHKPATTCSDSFLSPAAADAGAYDEIHRQALHMADMLLHRHRQAVPEAIPVTR